MKTTKVRPEKVRIEMLKRLDCYRPTSELERAKDVIRLSTGRVYGKKKLSKIFIDHSCHYPVIIDADGSPWDLGNRYVLSRLSEFSMPSARTLESIAGDLVCFRKWLLEEEINLLKIPSRVGLRPTYRYCSNLNDLVAFNQIQPSTAKRRMSTVQNFYRWLELDGFEFPYALWVEHESKLNFTDYRGLVHRKSVKSTDLTSSFKLVRKNNDPDDYLSDGGMLRPLTRAEQVALVEALGSIGNTEMTLAFLLALTTGARLQTVFTFREDQVSGVPRDAGTAKRIKVGSGTKVNTKFGKQMVLLVPNWLYRRLQIYSRSPRRLARVAKSKHVYPNTRDQYLFLTRAGRPYYMAKDDPFDTNYRSPPRGNAVTQFIHQQLIPELTKQGQEFRFRFHDLRASFGMNLIESIFNKFSINEDIDETQPEFFQVLMYVRERMGHARLSTTERYLNYTKKFNISSSVQCEFESFLKTMLDEM